MANFLLDTSVIIDAINDKRGRRQMLRDLIEQNNILSCCAINVSEVYAGMRPKEEENTKTFLSTLEYYPIGFAEAEAGGLFKRDHAKKGVTLSLTDSLIAAVAIHNHLTLITDNTKDFPMREIRLHPLPN